MVNFFFYIENKYEIKAEKLMKILNKYYEMSEFLVDDYEYRFVDRKSIFLLINYNDYKLSEHDEPYNFLNYLNNKLDTVKIYQLEIPNKTKIMIFPFEDSNWEFLWIYDNKYKEIINRNKEVYLKMVGKELIKVDIDKEAINKIKKYVDISEDTIIKNFVFSV